MSSYICNHLRVPTDAEFRKVWATMSPREQDVVLSLNAGTCQETRECLNNAGPEFLTLFGGEVNRECLQCLAPLMVGIASNWDRNQFIQDAFDACAASSNPEEGKVYEIFDNLATLIEGLIDDPPNLNGSHVLWEERSSPPTSRREFLTSFIFF
uniref:Uncharacterized protein n=1 Tax=viral metagenome TaxID=1070528 RepID=A0A6C0BPR8_9ZZZZ